MGIYEVLCRCMSFFDQNAIPIDADRSTVYTNSLLVCSISYFCLNSGFLTLALQATLNARARIQLQMEAPTTEGLVLPTLRSAVFADFSKVRALVQKLKRTNALCRARSISSQLARSISFLLMVPTNQRETWTAKIARIRCAMIR
jgi:hypothetical protein